MSAVYGPSQRPAAIDDLAKTWPGKVGLTAALAAAYYLTAWLSLGLLLEPDGVAVFWPAAGISSGVLIALGPRARWPVAVGVVIATIPANLMGDRNLPAAIGFGLCNAVEALITAGLIHHYFGANLHLGRLRATLGLLVAAVLGTAISGIGGAVVYKLFHSPDVPMLISWRHWFASDAIGILAVAPLFIGIATVIRRPPVRGEIPEAFAALGALTAMTLLIVAMPQRAWETVLPLALLAPILLWLAARFRSVFSAVGGFMVSLIVVLTAIYGIGHFGSSDLPVDDRILQAQMFVVTVMLGALVIAALFAERRRAEARLVNSNIFLQRERESRLMNVDAVIAAIAHEINQPLASIMLDGATVLQFLNRTPPAHQDAKEALNSMMSDARRASDVFESIRTLFKQSNEPEQEVIDANETVLEVLGFMRGELTDFGVRERIRLAPALPVVSVNKSQLREVILNLLRNALEAMSAVPARNRELQITTAAQGQDAVIITVQDSGPGIDRSNLSRIFDVFFTTKEHGMGLGLAICRMIIERRGGQLTATSDGKTGTLFSILLPTRPSDGGTPARSNQQNPQQ
jgi:signal transduction histidine kinase